MREAASTLVFHASFMALHAITRLRDDAQDRLHHQRAADADAQQGERCRCRMWNDPVVDLQDPEREGETEQIDDDRCRKHIGRQARQRPDEKAKKLARIALDQQKVLVAHARPMPQRTRSRCRAERVMHRHRTCKYPTHYQYLRVWMKIPNSLLTIREKVKRSPSVSAVSAPAAACRQGRSWNNRSDARHLLINCSSRF